MASRNATRSGLKSSLFSGMISRKGLGNGVIMDIIFHLLLIVSLVAGWSLMFAALRERAPESNKEHLKELAARQEIADQADARAFFFYGL